VYKRVEMRGGPSLAEQSLETDTYYDPRGRTVLEMGRQTTQHTYGDSGPCGCTATCVSLVAKNAEPQSYAECLAVQASDEVLEETHTIWALNGRDVAGYATVERYSDLVLQWMGGEPDGPLTTAGFISAESVNYEDVLYGRVSTRFIVRDAMHREIRDVDFGNADHEPRQSPSSVTRSLAHASIEPTDQLMDPYRVTLTGYDRRGFVDLMGNERGDSTRYERDEMGRETVTTRLQGTGRLPTTTSPSQACMPPEIERKEYDGGRLDQMCLSMDPCPEMPMRIIDFEYGDDAPAWPYASLDSMLDNNVVRSMSYPGSFTVDMGGPSLQDRFDFARNTLGEMVASRDSGGAQTLFDVDLSTGREMGRFYDAPPAGLDQIGMPFFDDFSQGTGYEYDDWGRVKEVHTFDRGNTLEDFRRHFIDRGAWGEVLRVRQDGVGFPDDDVDGGFREVMFPPGWEQEWEYDFIDGTLPGEGGYWRGVRPRHVRLPGMPELPPGLDPDEILYAGIMGMPAAPPSDLDLDSILGRASAHAFRGEIWARYAYYGMWHPAAEVRPQANAARLDHSHLGMMIKPGDPNYPLTPGYNPWGEREDDLWRYCASMNACEAPHGPGVVPTPIIGTDRTTRPDELCVSAGGGGSRCEIEIENTTDPRDNRQVEVQCSATAQALVEYTGPEPGAGVTLLPKKNRRVDFRVFDEEAGRSRGNMTRHKRLHDLNDNISLATPLSKPGDFDEDRTYTNVLSTPQGHASDQTASSTRDIYQGPDEVMQARHDARGNLRTDWGAAGRAFGAEGPRAFQYDAVNRLTEVRRLDGVVNGSGGTASGAERLFARYTYDGLGRRTSARYGLNPGQTTLADDAADVYLYDDAWRVVAVAEATPTVNAGNVTGYATRLRERYVYAANRRAADGGGGDTPLGRELDLDGDGVFDRQQFFLEDRQGSVVAVMERRDANADGTWDGEARLIARVAYTAFGEPEIYRPGDANRDGVVDAVDLTFFEGLYADLVADVPGSEKYFWFLDADRDGAVADGDPSTTFADLTAFGATHAADVADEAVQGTIAEYLGALPLYAGYWWDPQVKLYHVRHRVYDPQAGRWLQRDPIGYKGGPNLYGYVGNEPWLFTDPMGLSIWSDIRDTIDQYIHEFTEGAKEVYDTVIANPVATLKGVAKGAAKAAVATIVITAIAVASPVVGTIVAVGAVGYAVYATTELASEWNNMSLEERAEAIGEFGGGILGTSGGYRLASRTRPLPNQEPQNLKATCNPSCMGMTPPASGSPAPVCTAPVKPTWPSNAKDMDAFLGVKGKRIPDTARTPGRDKVVWDLGNIKITFEQHPYHPNACVP
jgi:RHS repeat-associated protein